MKGKLVYTAIVEKEIEIPDEVIDALDTIATSWDPDANALIDKFSADAWASVDNVENRLSIQFEQDGEWWAFEEY
jgi:hypothetical protein